MDNKVKLRRLSNEDVDQFIYRICHNKAIGVYDLTWEQVADILNKETNNSFTSAKWRKDYQIGEKHFKMRMKDFEDFENYKEELKLLKLELEMEKIKARDEAIFNRRYIREGARQEHFFEKVEKAIKEMPTRVPKFYPLEKQDGNSEWLLGISDIHAYSTFEAINNKFSKDILEDRMNLLLGELKKIVKKEKISKITVINGGDNLEGVIRIGQLASQEADLITTLIEYQAWLYSWLVELSSFVNVEYRHLISANHTEIRMFGQKAGQQPKMDLERVIADYLYTCSLKDKDMLKGRLKVIIPKHSFATFKLAGYEIIAHHGHMIKNKENYLLKMSRKLRTHFDYAIFGHLHHSSIKTIDEGVDNDCEVIGLPSIIGTDTYADKLLVGAKAGALLLKFEKNKGRTQENKIILN